MDASKEAINPSKLVFIYRRVKSNYACEVQMENRVGLC
jgi:hypothetical protein